ncbi:MAG: T9SS type A sorting domain-containing protein, partial [Bacteroidales bacterium]|nr:T9SS type A sorting domain-containing protein [Bacteroidales bacterium]
NQSFSISVPSGCVLVDVLVDGASVGAVTSYEFTDVLSNHTIQPVCEPTAQYIIAASTSAGGSVSPSGSIPVDEGSNLTVCGTPDAGCEIQSVIVNGSDVGAVSCYTFTNVMMDYSIQFNYTCDNPITVTNVITDCNGKKKARNIISVNVSVPHKQLTSSRGKVINDGAGKYRVRETNVAFGSTNTYKITAKNGNTVVGTVSESVKAVSKCPKAAIELSPSDNDEVFDFTIYPNPSSAGFNIQLDTEAYVTIYNTMGKVVYFKHINEGITYIESSNLSGKGLYFININGKTKILEQL